MSRGYRAVTVADIVRRAGIARNTFYDNFSSKEDCFLATQDYAVEESLARVVEAAADADGWEALTVAGLGAFLKYVAERARPGAHLHRRGALRRRGRAGALRAVDAGLRPAAAQRPRVLRPR